ncbi:MAG: MFS transporter [Mediterranea massiliensis]|nr:MFS transporter [Mediterranea massiliensis]MBO5380926.1 MFS transporter [Bacteroides sp.]
MNQTKKTNWRWWICLLLFVATTINYMDRQVLSLTWKDYIAPEFHWTDSDYGTITGFFSIFYAVASLFAGRFVDWMGTKKGYLWAIFVWSVGACLHAACGWATMHIEGIESIEALKALEAGSQAALVVATVSVWLFLVCRAILALGEAGNFPAAIKVTAEYFPKKDRAYATSLFNAGSSVGALAAPLSIPILADAFGWEMAFIIIGVLGFIWMFFWMYMYEKPQQSKHVSAAELEYILQDEKNAPVEEKKVSGKEEKTIPFFDCFRYRQTWSFITGKFFTDGVWWFYLFWAPAYFSECGYSMQTTTGKMLVFVLYLIVTVVSIFGGYLPKLFVEKKGMEPYAGRMLAMLIFAFFPLFALFAQPLQGISVWFPAIIIGLAGAGHQAWSANLFSTIGDMFPKSTIATITGIGTMAGGIASFLINKGAGMLFDYAAESNMTFLGFVGKPAGYFIIFCICAVAYIIAWSIMKTLVPKHKPIVLD